MQDILNLLKGQKVYIFCTDPQIHKLFLEPHGLEVISNTACKKDEKRNCSFTDFKIVLPPEKREQINNIFLNEWGFKDRITIGVNMFSAYYDTTIAMWADLGGPWLAREILKNSNAKYFLTRKKTLDLDFDNKLKNKITHLFDWSGARDKDYKTSKYDLEYKGYIYWWRTILIGVMHVCGMAEAKEVYITGAAWNPCIAHHFYENMNISNMHPFVNKDVIEITKTFPVNFPKTKFYKTNSDSFIPFAHIDLKEAIK